MNFADDKVIRADKEVDVQLQLYAWKVWIKNKVRVKLLYLEETKGSTEILLSMENPSKWR